MVFKLWVGLHGAFNTITGGEGEIFFMHLMYLSKVVFSSAEEGIKKEDASNTFVSAEFSRSFV